VTHTWTEQGTYIVKAKAKDSMNGESNWGILSVVMPTEYQFSLQTLLQHLFERFPHMFPVLRHLTGY